MSLQTAFCLRILEVQQGLISACCWRLVQTQAVFAGGELQPGVILAWLQEEQDQQQSRFGDSAVPAGRGTNFHKRALALCPAAGPGRRQQFWFREEGRVKLHLGSARPCARCCMWLDSRSWSFAHVVPGIYLVGSLLLQQDLWFEEFYHHLPH